MPPTSLSIPAPPSDALPPREHAAAGVPSRSTSSRPASLRPRGTPERLLRGRELIRSAAEAGERIRSYEVALAINLSEFHFARLFRATFGRSPHVYYDEVRAERARAMLRNGLSEGEVARRVGFRRPAELRALLSRRGEQGDQDRATKPAAAAAAAAK